MDDLGSTLVEDRQSPLNTRVVDSGTYSHLGIIPNRMNKAVRFSLPGLHALSIDVSSWVKGPPPVMINNELRS